MKLTSHTVKCNRSMLKAQPHRGNKRRRDEEQINTPQTPYIKSQTHKQRRTGGLRLVLGLYSDAVSNYKYMFGPHRGPLYVRHLQNNIVKDI